MEGRGFCASFRLRQARESREPGAWSLERGSWRWRRQTSDGQTSDFSGVASGDDFNNAAEPPPVKPSFGGGWPRRGRVMGRECENVRLRTPFLNSFLQKQEAEMPQKRRTKQPCPGVLNSVLLLLHSQFCIKNTHLAKSCKMGIMESWTARR